MSKFLSLNNVPLKFNNNIMSIPNENFDPETLNYKLRILDHGGSISDSALGYVDEFVKLVKSYGFRQYFYRFNPFLGDDTVNYFAAQVPLFYNSDGSNTPLGYSIDDFISSDSF